MYLYTDDDLTRVNRDYLGPKGKRLPWTAQYRTYGVFIVVAFLLFFGFLMLGIPANKYSIVSYGFILYLSMKAIVRKMDGQVSLWASFKTGWQEMDVPRQPRETTQTVGATIKRYGKDEEPDLRWWQRIGRRKK